MKRSEPSNIVEKHDDICNGMESNMTADGIFIILTFETFFLIAYCVRLIMTL